MFKLIKHLQQKWGVSNTGVLLIGVVFACTGVSVVALKPVIFNILLAEDASPYIKWLVYIIVIFPLYQVLLLGYGFLFKQFDFFWKKEKKMISFIAACIAKLFKTK